MKGWKALIALIVLALAATVGGSQDAYAAKRVALVIGNSDYTSFPKLDNPVKDGESLRDALISIDFDVVFRKNVTLDGFADGLAEFVEKARSAEVAIVYYAGHGVQHDERNYLIPVNGKAQDLDDLDFRSEPVDMVVRALQRAPGTRISSSTPAVIIRRRIAMSLFARSATIRRDLAALNSQRRTSTPETE